MPETVRLTERGKKLHDENMEMLHDLTGVEISKMKTTLGIDGSLLFANVILKELTRRRKGASPLEAAGKFIFSFSAWRKKGTTLIESFAPIYTQVGFALEEIKNDIASLEEVEITEVT